MSRDQKRSIAAFARAKAFFPGGVNSPVRAFRSVGGEPFVVSHGSGAHLFDVDGNRYVDFVGSWGPLVLGHAHPKVVEAITEQARAGTSYGACCEQEAELAAKVKQLVPSLEMLRFVNSGTEAGMAVVRLARAFTKREKIVKFAGCYHGHVDALLVQAGSGVATLGLPDSPGVPESVTGNTITVPFNDIGSVEQIFRDHGSDIAAVLLEPIVGNAGYIEPVPGFLEGLREVTSRAGALLVFDEVMTGFRVALGGAQSLYKIKPDLSMFGKVIGGGLPVGAYGGRADIMSLIAPAGPVYQAGTLSGNPLAMVAGTVTLDEWSMPGVFEAAAAAAERIVEGVRTASANHGIPVYCGHKGTMFGFFFQDGPVRSYEDAKRSDTQRFAKFFNSMLDRGVYFAPSQFEAGFVSSAHSPEVIGYVVDATDAVFADL